MPRNLLGATAWRCNHQVVAGIQKGILDVQKSLARCDLGAIVAGTTTDCAADLAATLTADAATIDARFAACRDTTGMLGCRFDMGAAPACLGTAAVNIGTDLVDTLFPPN